jgi:drug/metabolite transporter (DMT)-like permease
MNRAQAVYVSILLVLSVVFGSSFLLMKVAAKEASALEIVTIRLTVGAVVLAGVLALRGRATGQAPAMPLSAAPLGAFKLLAFGLLAWGIHHVDSGTSAVLYSTIPIFTALFATVLVADERMTANRAAGLGAAFAGVAVLAGGAAFDSSSTVVVAQLALATAAASAALSGVFAKRLLVGADALSVSSVQIGAGAVLAWPLLLAVEGAPSFDMSTGAWAALLVLGGVQTGVAWAGYTWMIERGGSVKASLVAYLMPPVALFSGWLFLDEQITSATIGGLALIICGIVVVMRPRAAAGSVPVAASAVPAPGATAPGAARC